MSRLIRSACLTAYAEVAQACGLDPAAMLAEFQLPSAALGDIELKIPVSRVEALLEASAQRSGDASFSLRMAEKRRLAHLGPLGLLMREQPTLHDALRAVARYANRLNNAVFVTLEEARDVVVVRVELLTGAPTDSRQGSDLAHGVVFLSLREALGRAFRPQRVCVSHAAPRNRSLHRRIFGDRLAFSADFTGIVFARRDLVARNPRADPIMARYAREMLETRFRASSLVTHQVREMVLTRLRGGRAGIDAVARSMGVSRRTLHRHLASEGRTFSAIVDDVRRELAVRYLADRHRPLVQVSGLLGFSAPSGFSRWYRRAFGTAPQASRVTRRS